jgi:ferredoxin
MSSSSLRKFRVIFASLLIISVAAVFLDIRRIIPEGWVNGILYIQFLPSLLKFINLPSLLASGFLVVLALTVFTGRSYCSFLCPLGIFQDIVSRIAGVIKRKNRKFRFTIPYTITRYSILALTVIVALAGSLLMVTILDPYSIFGRMMTYFLKPAVVEGNNLLASILTRFDIYTLYTIQLKGITAAAFILPLSFLGLTGYMAYRHGRLYCNTVCPVGTFLGLISKVSVFGLRIDSSSCTRCGRCAVACKSSCIDFLHESIDVTRCVTCFNCIDSCNDKAISFGVRLAGKPVTGEPEERKKAATGVSAAVKPESIGNTVYASNGESAEGEPGISESVDTGKRNFILNSLILSAAFTGIANGQDAPVPTKASTVRENREYPVCPPGGIGQEHFNDYCTACSLCVSACPTSVLRPSFRSYGLAGIMQPVMDYHKGFCNFECTVCIDVCPTGALMPLMLEAKKLTQIGKVRFIKENCIVETERTDCGACSEHCPTKAVKMVPFIDNLVIPEVEEDICIGCGACEYACPTVPFKAIYVNGNPIHLDAKKPESGTSDEKALEEFPF